MATTFYPQNTASTATMPAGFAGTAKELLLTRGPGVASQTDNTVASLPGDTSAGAVWGNATSQNLSTMPTGAGTLVFVSNPLASVSISGTISGNLRALESNAMANYGLGFGIYVLTSSGTSTVQLRVIDSVNELGTSESARTPSGANSFSIGNTDRIAMIVFYGGIGTSASGFTAQGFWNGASGATGDTFVTFTETIVEYTSRPTIPVQRNFIYLRKNR